MAWYRKSVSTMITFSHISSSSSNSRISHGFSQPLKNRQQQQQQQQRYIINSNSPFLHLSKRFFFHNVDTNNKVLEHSKPKNLLSRTGLLGLLLGFGVVITSTAYYWNLERVPYAKRSHFVLFSTSLERELGKFVSEKIIKPEYEGKILGGLHPSSIRVQRIGQDIVEGAEKGLKEEEEGCMIVSLFKKLGKRDYDQIPQLEWEFFVVDEPMICNARCYPGGKFVFFTGLLHTCESDAEIAAAIGHEVGHAIARHSAEHFSRLPGVAILKLFLYWSINFHLVPAISKFLAWLPYCRRHSAVNISRLRCPAILKLFLYWKTNLSLMPAISEFLIRLPSRRRKEKEADYIGLILMALAGYDPRVVVESLDRDEYYESAWSLGDFARTHPSTKKRVQLLSQPKVMEEALSLYKEVLLQRGVR